jgi:hypothetical protein
MNHSQPLAIQIPKQLEDHMFRKSSAKHHQASTQANGATGTSPQACASAGCQGVVADPWEANGRYCPTCAIEHYLFDRDARWEDQIPRLQTQLTPRPEVLQPNARPATALRRMLKQVSVLLGIAPGNAGTALPPGQAARASLRTSS